MWLVIVLVGVSGLFSAAATAFALIMAAVGLLRWLAACAARAF